MTPSRRSSIPLNGERADVSPPVSLSYKAVCLESEVLFDLSPLDFCSVFVELTAACSALLGWSPFTAGWRSGWVAASEGGETTTLSMGSLAVLSVTIR